jgi:hypothetical protein
VYLCGLSCQWTEIALVKNFYRGCVGPDVVVSMQGDVEQQHHLLSAKESQCGSCRAEYHWIQVDAIRQYSDYS